MTSVVHFKFRSSLKFDSIRFTGHEISIQELKEEIVKTKKLDKFMEDYDLMITNDQTKNEYKPDDCVPKNSSVIVARFPITKPKRDLQKKAVSSPIQIAENESTLECISKMADVASMNLSEEDKLITVMDQGNREFDNVNYNKLKKIPRGPIPKNYVCHRCGLPGHYIQKCPKTRDSAAPVDPFPKLKRSTGIPISFMTTVEDINTPGVLLTSCGKLAVPIIDAEAYRVGKKEKPPFVKSDEPEQIVKTEMPKELLCPVCDDLLTEAIVLPCCGDSACDNCVMTELLQSTSPKCPVCKKSGISPLDVIPNNYIRTAVLNYKNETGYTAMTAARREVTVKPEIKFEPEIEQKPLMNISSKGKEEDVGLEYSLDDDDKSSEPIETLTAPELPFQTDQHRFGVQDTAPPGTHLPMNEPFPMHGMKGTKIMRVLVARPGAPMMGEQSLPGASFNQLSAMNMYSLPPPPLPHNYVINQPRMVQGMNAMPLAQTRNVLIYPGPLPPSRMIGPPPMVPIGTGAPLQMTFPPRIPGTIPIAMPMPGVARMPMSEAEFYREKERLRELERRRGSMSPYNLRRDSRPARNKDVFEFAEDIMYKKGRHRNRSRSRSYIRSRTKSRTRRSSSFSTASSPFVRAKHQRSNSKKYRNSASPADKSRFIRGSPSPRKDAPGKTFRNPSRRKSTSPNKPRDKRSISPIRKENAKRSRSPNKAFRSSRSNSSRRSYVRRRSRSRSQPVKKYHPRDEKSQTSHRSNNSDMVKRKADILSRSPPRKRSNKDAKEVRPFMYSPYEHVPQSSSPARQAQRNVPNPKRYIEKASKTGTEDYYKQYKEWHDKYDRDRQNVPRNPPRKRDVSLSPLRRRRQRSMESRSHSRESRGPSFRGGRRDERMEEWRESERRYAREHRLENNNLREQIKDGRMKQEMKEYTTHKEKEINRAMERDYASKSMIRKQPFNEARISEDRQARRMDERKNEKVFSPKPAPKSSLLFVEKDLKPQRKSEIRSPPPKSKVQIISPKEPRVKEAQGLHYSTMDSNQVPKETSVRIVTKDICKTMKITVSSKWDSDKEHEKRLDRERSFSGVILDEESEKAVKVRKKHKKEKKKHSKKHRSKGPE